MYLDRLARYNGQLNCVVTITDTRALAEAAAADKAIAAGKYLGILHGIPYGVKDIIAAKGYPTRWGAPHLDRQTFDEDATVVQRLHAAGAVLVAKLTTGEMAFGDQWAGGRTNNPWNLSEGSSGSSAGSARGNRGGTGRLRDRHRYRRFNSFAGGALRHRRVATDVRARQPVRRDGGRHDARQGGADVPPRPGLRDRVAGDRGRRREGSVPFAMSRLPLTPPQDATPNASAMCRR